MAGAGAAVQCGRRIPPRPIDSVVARGLTLGGPWLHAWTRPSYESRVQVSTAAYQTCKLIETNTCAMPDSPRFPAAAGNLRATGKLNENLLPVRALQAQQRGDLR